MTDGEAASIGKLLIEVSEELANMRRVHGDEVARAVAEERAAAVAYLRACNKRCHEWDGRENAVSGTYRLAADDIERGYHRTGTKP